MCKAKREAGSDCMEASAQGEFPSPRWKGTTPQGGRDGRDTRLQPHLSK